MYLKGYPFINDFCLICYFYHRGTEHSVPQLVALLEHGGDDLLIDAVGVLPHHGVVDVGVEGLTLDTDRLQTQFFQRLHKLAKHQIHTGLVILTGGGGNRLFHIIHAGQQGREHVCLGVGADL